ncbi:MAG: hypothetical protein V7605_2139 [Acidimicrobiaceae bacterium]|jgi:uncharacterized protein YegL
MAARPLDFIWVLDCSGSMRFEGRIQALNTAIAEAAPLMGEVAESNPHAQLLVRAVTFSDGAKWHVADAVPATEFTWTDVAAGGDSDMGAALSLVAGALEVPPMPERALPPVLVLVSDGQPTDDFESGLHRLLATPWGPKAIRVAIAIGRDAGVDVLQEFIGVDSGRRPLHAGSPDDLAAMIRWSSTVVVGQASQPRVDSTVPNPLTKPPPPEQMLVWGDGPDD